MDPLNRDVLRAELKRDEGNKLKAYRDTLGLLSIGVGRNLDRGDGGITAHETAELHITRASVIQNGLTQVQCDALLDNDIDAVMRGLDNALPWWRKLDPVRQRVIVNLGFMGIGNASHGLLSFKNTLKLIEIGRYAEAAKALLASKYAQQVGARAIRLADLLRAGPRQL